MSGRTARTKGKHGELEIVHILQEAGYDVARTPNSGGLRWKGDIHGMVGFHWEVKRQERVSVDEWCEKAELQADGKIPVVVYRKSRSPWRVVLRLEDFLELMER